jgi:phosphate transport system permease protein
MAANASESASAVAPAVRGATGDIRKLIARAKRWDVIFIVLGILALGIGFLTFLALFVDMLIDGWERLRPEFFTQFPSRRASQAGILSAWIGTTLVMIVTAVVAVPLGVAAGIYLEEYAPKNWVTDVIEINITNLAGVPSIVYGLLALGLFVYAVGATRWQTVKDHIVPYSMPGILTGVIIGLSRAIGETAPIITIGALTFIAFLPPSPVTADFPFLSFEWLQAPFTVMPIQMFNWTSRPDEAFHANAAAAGAILVFMTLTMNGLAIWLRYRLRKNIKW